ncbi:MAG TPA: iron-containing alcohol dehydrogenase [archaeon]|nr:iron-containing alcohol dehydrogenase [archaeon]
MESLVEAFALPRWIEAFPGCLDGVGRWAGKLGSRAFIGTGRSAARKSGLLLRVESSLRREGMAYEIFEGIEAEPALETAEKGAELARHSRCDVFIGLGGGSVLDTVKLIAMLQENPPPAEDYQLERRAFSAPCKPVIAVPTTAGTGSEATKVSVMTNRRLKVKKSLYSWEMVATVALLDAEATADLPPELTRETGLDALGQAIEGYLSTNGNEIIAAAAARTIRLVRRNLPLAMSDGHNIQARHNMLIAALLGGVSIDTGVGLGHELAMSVGSLKGISHGLLVGILTPYCLEANIGWADQKIAEIAYYFGCPYFKGAELASRALVDELFDFNRGLGLPLSLGDLGVRKDETAAILEARKLATNIKTNPRPLDDIERKRVLHAAIDGRGPGS